MQLVLLETDGGDGRRYTLANGETIIGRRPDCRIVLDAPSISPRHARLFVVDGHAVIHGIDDAWPVYVNGETVVRQVLTDGDDIELGHYRMRYVDATNPANADDEPMPDPAIEAAGEAGMSDTAHMAPEAPLAPIVDDGGAPPAGPEALDSGWGEIDDTPPADMDPAASAVRTHAAPSDSDEEPKTAPGEPEDTRPSGYHLDILTGINQGRRVAMTRDLVVLGFNQQRLVEIHNDDGALSLRRVDDEAVARLNGVPITDEPAGAKPGDIISLQRIDLRIHQAG